MNNGEGWTKDFDGQEALKACEGKLASGKLASLHSGFADR